MNIINDRVTSYINGLYRSLDPELGELRKKAEEDHVPIILRDTETLLLTLLQLKKPDAILEIGTAVGYSALCMAAVCPDCRIITIEADGQMYEAAEKNKKALNPEARIEFVLGQGQEVLGELKGAFDLVFIDAAKSHYRTFWDKALPLCRPGAMIICDNVLMKAMTVSDQYDPKKKYKTSIRRMREFLTYITNVDYADTSVLPVGDGVSISILKG